MATTGEKRREERTKLFASALSNIGVGFFVAGWVGPSVTGHLYPSIAVGAALLGFGFHLVAQCVLHYVVMEPSRSGNDEEDR